ncbi:Glycosyl hydrolase family 115 [Duganella sp. CF517]|uniref:glycosyl hydrolase 115 family protein n=1 Tax=Duganella sp. CF517 TaxID=1881038 RepID=UPI0008D272CA|nr:glycosyl hydrolase 115 family protein [Duganella sp. CF517]SEN09956.1 Glycosyl hydrolase family 115 [Duganella sp. CF517]
MRHVKICSLLFAATSLLGAAGAARAAPLQLLDAAGAAPTVLADDDEPLTQAAGLLRRDLDAVTGQPSQGIDRLEQCAQLCFVIGRYDAPLVAGIARRAGLDLRKLRHQWERYERIVIPAPGQAGARLVLIAGSDTRGAIYGAVDVTREIGVSAWEWWADVKPAARADAAIDDRRVASAAPSVQYRGIFLNDEDWGLQPWAAGRDPSGDIGPATYERIFELMLRLKANLIWPAMHESTKPFYQIAGNAAMAKRYGIVVGTSHAEPMMRNNVREWDHKARGEFNFFTNKDALVSYWDSRAQEVKEFENIYSVGIRGIHDSGMEGADTVPQARKAVEQVIGIERDLLSKAQGKPAAQIPQALTLYKEVLDIYKAGLVVPDDVTLVWPDDNYGYLHQLSTPAEARRGGGTGLYYHLSYWGRPHDYLWLATTHPALVRDQLQRAIATGTRKLWVVNVGDIKPGEYLTDYFLDAAFDATKLDTPAQSHLEAWLQRQFGPAQAREIGAVLKEYYDLAWERRPEFMGFSQVESITPARASAYLDSGGEEAEQRLLRYRALADRAQAIGAAMPASQRDAYFQLVLYPVRASANLNTRILKLDLASQYARAGRPVASLYAARAAQAQADIAADTKHYNSLANGKWQGMMDAAPRNLPVFVPGLIPTYGPSPRKDCSLVYPAALSGESEALTFTKGVPAAYTLTLVNYAAKTQPWSVEATPAGLSIDRQDGELNADNGYEQRLSVRYDGRGDTKGLRPACGATALAARIDLASAPGGQLSAERERIVALPAASGHAGAGWEKLDGLGSYGSSMRARLDLPSRALSGAGAAPALTYEFATSSGGDAQLKFVALPVHPLTSAHHVRLAYRLDNGPLRLLDFETVGRSDEWKANVLSNTAVRSATVAPLAAGSHRLQVYALDPGVILDRIEVSFDGAPRYYGKPL